MVNVMSKISKAAKKFKNRECSELELKIHSWLQDRFGFEPIEMPVTKLSEERKLYINRRAIEHFLRFVFPKMKDIIFLDKEGGIEFRHKEFLVTVEVVQSDYANVHIHAAVHKSDGENCNSAVIQKAMELNFSEKWRREAALGVKGNEIRFYFRMPVDGLRIREMKLIMFRFLKIAESISKKLDEANCGSTVESK